MAQGYSTQFWRRASELTSRKIKTCEECFVTNGEDITRARRPKRKVYAVVRVALRKPNLVALENLGLFCTKCRRGKYAVKARDTSTIPMFGEENGGSI